MGLFGWLFGKRAAGENSREHTTPDAPPTAHSSEAMLERFDAAARRVIASAADEALASEDFVLFSQHLLLSILKQDTVATRSLKAHGVTRHSVLSEVEKLAPRDPASSMMLEIGIRKLLQLPDGEIPPEKLLWTPGFRKIIEYACEEARIQNCDQVTLDHLLLGLLRDSDCVSAQVLTRLGAKVEDVRNELLGVMTMPPPVLKVNEEQQRLISLIARTTTDYLSGIEPVPNRTMFHLENYLAQVGPDGRVALRGLIQGLEHAAPNERSCAALALGHLGAEAKTAVTALKDLLNDSDEIVRHNARVSLRKIDPQWGREQAESLYQQGRTEMGVGGRKDAALRFLNEAIEVDPTHADAHEARSNIYISLDRVDEGIADLRRAMELAAQSGGPLRDNAIG